MDNRGFGWRPQLTDHRDKLLDTVASGPLPSTFSLRSDPSMPPVYNQEQLGSCTANALTSAFAFLLAKEGFTPPSQMYSRLFVYYEERKIEGTIASDAGADLRDGAKVLAGMGAPIEEDWAYDITQFATQPPQKAYTDAVNHVALDYLAVDSSNPDNIRQAISNGYPVPFGFSVPAKFQQLTQGSPLLTLPTSADQIVGGHAVKATGWDFSQSRFPGVNVFEVKNSWGPGWGDSGYFYIDAKYFDPSVNLASDCWTFRKSK